MQVETMCQRSTMIWWWKFMLLVDRGRAAIGLILQMLFLMNAFNDFSILSWNVRGFANKRSRNHMHDLLRREPLNHSGTRRIECLEEMGDAVWELDRASQTLTFTGFVKTTEGIGGLLVSSIIHRITLEMVLPLERMIMALNLNGVGRGSHSTGPRGPRPRVGRTARMRVRSRSPVYYNFVNHQANLRMNNNENQIVPDEDHSEDSSGGDANGNNGSLPNGH
ncbi:unnamed protein product [Trifolium pratense]|uniref:Uncharacterized protein n=1 Tax=Trifolium pratense TaxID=57577 RepID=A0ACB0J0Y1_TRIPR|nr:unnamed protein product [Trifolium pratense]